MGKVTLSFSKSDLSGGTDGAVIDGDITQAQMDDINTALDPTTKLDGNSFGSVLGKVLRAVPITAKVTADQGDGTILVQTSANSKNVCSLTATESVSGDTFE